jgi:hypothetical protein
VIGIGLGLTGGITTAVLSLGATFDPVCGGVGACWFEDVRVFPNSALMATYWEIYSLPFSLTASLGENPCSREYPQ